jgi:hypothetical protein
MSVLTEIKRRIAAAKTAFIEPCLPTLADKPRLPARAGSTRRSMTATACSLGGTPMASPRHPQRLRLDYPLCRHRGIPQSSLNGSRTRTGMIAAVDDCPICSGARWVCEAHPDWPWGDVAGACTCGAPGKPCDICNPSNGPDDPPDMPPELSGETDLSPPRRKQERHDLGCHPARWRCRQDLAMSSNKRPKRGLGRHVSCKSEGFQIHGSRESRDEAKAKGRAALANVAGCGWAAAASSTSFWRQRRNFSANR